MKLIVYVNDTFEEEKALFNLDDNTVLVKGDYYHDKIDERIEGFLEGLDYSNKSYELLESENVKSNTLVFENCGFYNEGAEEDDEEIEYKNDENYDVEYEDNEEDNVSVVETPICIEIKPLINKYDFYIYSSKYENGQKLCTQDIIEVIEMVRDCEGDLYDGDDIVYSCLGLDFKDNIELVKEYGVEYDEEFGFVKRQ